MNISGVSLTRIRLVASPVARCHELEASATDRQERIRGFRQEVLTSATVTLIGAGGLGGEIGEGLARKGVGELRIFDPDNVQLPDLSRQRFFADDLYKPKAVQLARNLVREATGPSVVVGVPARFEDAARFAEGSTVAVCAPDNNDVRSFASVFFRERGVPLVTLGAGEDANNAYVFVQQPGGPCFGCLFPDRLRSERARCEPVAAVKDILKVATGLALFALDTLLMDRKRSWNYREVFLGGFVPDRCTTVERRPDCPLCGGPVTGWTARPEVLDS